ncbi:unnamed protein product, partial [Vitis vinifera]|uniref:Uncharacterized protein n=1 Tax=Vitis vinifera TaxID=29760 RepID=D7U1K7_VITVI
MLLVLLLQSLHPRFLKNLIFHFLPKRLLLFFFFHFPTSASVPPHFFSRSDLEILTFSLGTLTHLAPHFSRCEGDSHFHVLVFDMTASEIEYPCATNPTIDHTHHQVSLEILDDFPISQTTNHVDMIDIASSEEEFHPNEASSLLKSEEIESDFPPTQKTSKTYKRKEFFFETS